MFSIIVFLHHPSCVWRGTLGGGTCFASGFLTAPTQQLSDAFLMLHCLLQLRRFIQGKGLSSGCCLFFYGICSKFLCAPCWVRPSPFFVALSALCLLSLSFAPPAFHLSWQAQISTDSVVFYVDGVRSDRGEDGETGHTCITRATMPVKWIARRQNVEEVLLKMHTSWGGWGLHSLMQCGVTNGVVLPQGTHFSNTVTVVCTQEECVCVGGFYTIHFHDWYVGYYCSSTTISGRKWLNAQGVNSRSRFEHEH